MRRALIEQHTKSSTLIARAGDNWELGAYDGNGTMKPIEATTRMIRIPTAVGSLASTLACCSVFRADLMFPPTKFVKTLAGSCSDGKPRGDQQQAD